MYDLIIIGGGPGAMSAGIYAARKKLNTLLLTENFGGQAVYSPMVDNYPALPSLSGMELMQKFAEHLKKFEIEIKESEKAIEIKKENGLFKIITKNPHPNPLSASGARECITRSILIATGKSPRKLDVPGAEKFEGKGIVYCAICDAPMFEDKTVAVIGSGDSALYTAWDLTKYANKIFILNKYENFKSENLQLLDELSKNSKIKIIFNASVKKIKGDNFVNGLVYEQNSDEQELKIDGVFVAIGSIPNSNFVKDIVQLNEEKEIIIDCKTNQTSVPGIFAAGDVTDITEKQIIIAAAEGAKAVLNIYDYLKSF